MYVYTYVCRTTTAPDTRKHPRKVQHPTCWSKKSLTFQGVPKILRFALCRCSICIGTRGPKSRGEKSVNMRCGQEVLVFLFKRDFWKIKGWNMKMPQCLQKWTRDYNMFKRTTPMRQQRCAKAKATFIKKTHESSSKFEISHMELGEERS